MCWILSSTLGNLYKYNFYVLKWTFSCSWRCPEKFFRELFYNGGLWGKNAFWAMGFFVTVATGTNVQQG